MAATRCGMEPATLERIEDLFFSTKTTRCGLGLAAVRGIVRSHGGTDDRYHCRSISGTPIDRPVLYATASECLLQRIQCTLPRCAVSMVDVTNLSW